MKEDWEVVAIIAACALLFTTGMAVDAWKDIEQKRIEACQANRPEPPKE